MLKKIIVILVISVFALQQIDASHEPHHARSVSWAHVLPPLHHIKVQRRAHSRKPSINDKSYYESLVMDAYALSKKIQNFLLKIAIRDGFDSMLMAINEFNQAKNQVAEMTMISEKLKLYGTSISNNEMIARAETIRLEGESYTKQLHEIETKVLPDVKELELVSLEHPALSRPQSGDLMSVAVDEMKTEEKDSDMWSSRRAKNPPVLINVVPPPCQLQSISKQRSSGHHSRGHSLSSVRIPQAPVQYHVEQPLTPGIKACLGTVASVVVIGMTLAILHFQGQL